MVVKKAGLMDAGYSGFRSTTWRVSDMVLKGAEAGVLRNITGIWIMKKAR